jgi:hypothetical protein
LLHCEIIHVHEEHKRIKKNIRLLHKYFEGVVPNFFSVHGSSGPKIETTTRIVVCFSTLSVLPPS